MTQHCFEGRTCFVPLAFAALLMTGCSSIGGPAVPVAGVVAGAAAAAPAAAVKTVPVAAAPVEQVPDGVLAGPLGARISETDRKVAFAAQGNALATGQRKTWRGTSGGSYGYVEVGPEITGIAGNCRSYTHTIFFAGRPQSSAGQACHSTDGGWRST